MRCRIIIAANGATISPPAISIQRFKTFITTEQLTICCRYCDRARRGATPQRSAFLSAFFTLVGCHGLHVTAGLIWLVVMMAQVATRGFRTTVQRRLFCFSLFWHTLDIIWIWIFTVVYLMGVVA